MKKFVALVLCLTLVLTCFTALLGCGGNESGDTQGGNSASTSDNKNTSEGDKEYEMLTRNECHKAFVRADAYGENVAKSADSYSEAIGRFTLADGERTDDFGGVFIDGNGIYNICVVGDNLPATTEYLVYKRVDNSLKTLKNIYSYLNGVMVEYGIWEVSVCEVCNKVKICLTDESKIDLVIAQLKTEDLFASNALAFFAGSNEYSAN